MAVAGNESLTAPETTFELEVPMKRWLFLMIWGSLLVRPVQAQSNQELPEDPAHNELRAVRAGMVDAFNKRDIDRLLQYLHPDVVVVWQNCEVSRGREGVRAYYQKMLLDQNARLESMSVNLEVAELAVLHGKDKHTAVAYGNLGDHYKSRNGLEFDLNSLWSATLVKDGDRWLVVDAHASGNVFNNELMKLALRRIAIWTGAIALAVGLVVGAIITLLFKRRKKLA
jgi:ketosteroid isomerase-like protein